MRPNIRAQYPEMRIPDVGKRLGELWRTMDEGQREPFRELERDDKLRHEREKEAYLQSKSSENIIHYGGYQEEEE